MAKVLVTGAGGFIGANVVRSLLRLGDEVHVLRRDKSTLWRLKHIENQITAHYVEITDRKNTLRVIDSIEPERVFHLAHYGGNQNEDDPDMIRKVIIEGTAIIFESCIKVGSVKAIVNAGSSSEYGAKDSPMKEDMLLEPATGYGCAKTWATLYGQYLAHKNGLAINTLRLFSVFGPWESGMRFIPTAILSSIRKKPFKINDKRVVRDFVFVDDVVRAFLVTAQSDCRGQVINIGFGSQMRIKEMAELIFQYTERPVVEGGGEFRSFDQTGMWQADISKADKFIDWQPLYTREEGISKTVRWFYDNQHLY